MIIEEKKILKAISKLITKKTLNKKKIPYMVETYIKNTHLFSKGGKCDNIYIVLKGSFKVYVNNGFGKEVIINTLTKGSIMGELSVITNLPISADIISKETCTVIVIKKDDFIKLLNTSPNIIFCLLKYLAMRTQILTKKVTSLILSDVFGRITNLLKNNAVNNIVKGISHQDIASEVGCSREVTSKTLGMLSDEGYIKTGRLKIELLKNLPENMMVFKSSES